MPHYYTMQTPNAALPHCRTAAHWNLKSIVLHLKFMYLCIVNMRERKRRH
ncbi:hypothetical protein SAMN05216463_11372 [Xylanibacter ruminicola]|uniref:Uncharacterized protein n=1 Tax=Xylanibacter ruminicola TaxID=839 RepID=A0A1M6VNX0_XYLRU|nr:hypothetical protein SAMN05216463_11372 [Xylanibacter ruminicola]